MYWYPKFCPGNILKVKMGQKSGIAQTFTCIFFLFFHRRDEQPVKAQAVDEQHVSGAESLSIRWAILLPQMFNNQ